MTEGLLVEKRQRQMVEPADLFRFMFLQDARLSPNGNTVAYVVSHVDAEKEEEYAAIWLLSLETGESRRLTAGLARDTNPQWSPDGKQIAFLSTRGDKPQIYLIPVDGGEARALTAMKQGVGGGPAWSPSGKQIAFTACPAAEPPDPQKPYRVTRHIYRFDAVGYLDSVVQDIYVIPAEGGEPKQLTHDDCQNGMPLWSPDGQEILFTAAMFPDSHRVYPALRIVNLAGDVRDLVKDWGYAISAAWTPDGQRVVFVGSPFGRPIGSQNDLWVIDRQGGEPECRTAGLTFQVGGGLQADMPVYRAFPNILVSRNGQAAYVQVQEGGMVSIYRIALNEPESWSPVMTGERTCIPLDMDDKHLLFAVSTLDAPPELFIATVAGSNERRLTRLNADLLAEYVLPTVEHLSFSGDDGVPVEGWVMKPCIGEPPYPTILYIHGGPHSGFGHIFSFDFQMLAGAGYAVLFINQRGSTGYGDEFSTRIIGDWGNLDYKDLMAGVDFAIAEGIADPHRLGCCGLSGGGNLTCWIVGQTNRFKAAVPENPVTNWVSMYGVGDVGPWFAPAEMGGLPHEIPEVYRRCSPITYAHRCTTPTLLVQGEDDYRCPAEQAEQFYAVLKASGCIVEMVRLPASHAGSIHGRPIVRRVQNEVLLDWMNHYLLGISEDDERSDRGVESGGVTDP
ncbi:MAG: Dipeptidyl-peptidase 5 [Dehalococcoidia bacterium]|nr:Dipeptidyl-peptidase 5 [Bacillota bacterium]